MKFLKMQFLVNLKSIKGSVIKYGGGGGGGAGKKGGGGPFF